MNFNIALSTIFYVMIFIFPGIIFRKFYFRGNFTSQFSKGNLFERFTLTMFFSIISALLSVSVLILLRYLFDIRFLDSVSYKTIIDVFNDIKQEKIPYSIKNGAMDFFLLMSLIYVISMLLGAVMHSLVVGLKLDIKYPILKFNHPWHYIAKGKNIKELQNKKYLYTNIDVLIDDGYKKVMISGVLLDIIQNPQDNKIEHILVKDCKKYKFPEDYKKSKFPEDGSFETKRIAGNMMSFPMDKVINFNLTHITRDRNYDNVKRFLNIVLSVIFVIALLYLIISPWMERILFFEINGVLKKVSFSISSVILLSVLFGKISSYIPIEEQNYVAEKDNLNTEQKAKDDLSADKTKEENFSWGQVFVLSVILISVILWTLGFYRWYWVLGVYGILVIFGVIISFIGENKEK